MAQPDRFRRRIANEFDLGEGVALEFDCSDVVFPLAWQTSVPSGVTVTYEFCNFAAPQTGEWQTPAANASMTEDTADIERDPVGWIRFLATGGAAKLGFFPAGGEVQLS